MFLQHSSFSWEDGNNSTWPWGCCEGEINYVCSTQHSARHRAGTQISLPFLLNEHSLPLITPCVWCIFHLSILPLKVVTNCPQETWADSLWTSAQAVRMWGPVGICLKSPQGVEEGARVHWGRSNGFDLGFNLSLTALSALSSQLSCFRLSSRREECIAGRCKLDCH